MKKNLTILFLAVFAFALIYQNKSKLNSSNTSTYSQLSFSPTPEPSSAKEVAPSFSSSTPKASPFLRKRIQRSAEGDLIQQQIKDLSPASLDQQILNLKAQINALTRELQNYQNYESSLHRSAVTQLQFQQAMNQQRQMAIANRIASLQRELPSLREKLKDAQLNTDLNNPDLEEQIQTQISEQENDIKDLFALSEELASEALNKVQDLGNQLANSQNNLSANRETIESQINFLQEDLDRIQDEKAKSKELLSALKQRLNDLSHQNNSKKGAKE